MKNNELNIFVKKLLKKLNKTISIDEIKKIYFELYDEEQNEKKLYKKIYYLKNQGYIISLKKDLFYIKKPENNLDEESLIENLYWKQLNKTLKKTMGENYFIGGFKSLELHNNNFSTPEKIQIINPFKRGKEILFKGKSIVYLTYKIKNIDENKLFKILKRNSIKYYIDGKKFNIANYELSLLESLYSIPFEEERFIIEFVKKNIRKNYKRINLEVFEEFLKIGKYSSSVKKIYEISLGIRPDFSEKIKKILKKWYWM